MRTGEGDESARSWPAGVAWFGLIAALSLLVARRLGAFDLWRTVTMPDGATVRAPNGFAIVDHPFHAVRAESLRRALADGEMLRWIGHHQGGYPVEFYPLGIAALDVVAWVTAFGALPMIAIHKLVVIGVFLLPLAGFALMAGSDRRSYGIALLAGAGHLVVRGWWWSGGSMELIEWGLVTNVAAAAALVVSLPLAVRFIDRGARRPGVMAAALAAFALVTNPRSGLALLCLLGGTVIAIAINRAAEAGVAGVIARRCASLVAITALLAAPEIVSLIRYSGLYHFVHYSGYLNLRDYWDSSIQAVGGPFFVLGLAGFTFAWLPSGRVVTRAVAATLGLYATLTAMLVAGVGSHALIEQLETTRLMPFQRLLWLYLAASAVEIALVWLSRAARARSVRFAVDAGLVAATGIVLVLYVIAPPSFIPEGDRGLVAMPASAQPGIVDLEAAVKQADSEAAPGTAVLVLGTTLSWHDQLWAPLWSDRPFFYDDWLWYWQTRHYGAYDPATEHAYPSDDSTIDPEYLSRHGIGAVVVTGGAKPAARQATFLTLVRAGIWDVYRVNDPATIVTISGVAPSGLSIGSQRVSASGPGSGGTILIRRNWFPRWHATLNGKPVKITETDDGYMTVVAPATGEVVLELSYDLDWLDWLGRIGVAGGLLLVIRMLLPGGDRLRLNSRGPRYVPRAIPRVRSARR